MINREKMASFIDHTLLKPDVTKEQIRSLCEEAMNFGFWSVCVNPSYISLASRILRDSQVKVCGVVGFPLGANKPEVKAFEAEKAIKDGANEIDMVINLGALKSGNYEMVKRDIMDVVKKAEDAQRNIIVKVIIETGLLSDEEKIFATHLVKESGAHFVKTSTGINTSGATIEDIKLLRKTVGPNFGVKASGGIRTYADAIKLIKAGATRIGTSSGSLIIKTIAQ
jgi:deoxyribose-phosphate aldolase